MTTLLELGELYDDMVKIWREETGSGPSAYPTPRELIEWAKQRATLASLIMTEKVSVYETNK
jgi:hypothetical protein